MLEFFRSFMKSRIGLGVTLAFVGLIALAFAGGDIMSFGGLGGVKAGTTVGSAGDRKITATSVDFFARKYIERLRERDPKANLREFVNAGGLDRILDDMLDNAAMDAFGRKVGIVAGDRLIGSDLAKEPQFRGTTGEFDDATYKAVIGQQGFTDQVYRQIVADQLVGQQIQLPAAFGARAPKDLASRYIALLTETREGSIALVPAAAFAPKGPADPAELQKFYNAHRANYTVPERRTIRFITIDETAVKSPPAPTDAEIAAKYNADKAKYAASETRKLTQLVVPTEAAARVVLADLAKGMSLDDSARAKKLATAKVASIAKDKYAGQNSPAVADAVFAAAQGKIVGPVKGGLGWYVVRIDAVERTQARTLDQARNEIAADLAADKKRAAFAEFSERIETEIDDGAALSDIAKELNLQIRQSEALTADGRVYGKPEQTPPAELARVMQSAFQIDGEGKPQIDILVPGKSFIAYDVSAIHQSAPAPLAEIKDRVAADLALDKGAVQAKAAADKVLAAGRKGGDLAAAMAGLGVALPPVDKVAMQRVDIRRYGPSVPPPLALLFSMAQGTVKQLPAPNNRGWYIVSLKSIVPGTIAANDPAIQQGQAELGALAGREYAAQLRKAIRAEVKASTDPAAIKALVAQYASGN